MRIEWAIALYLLTNVPVKAGENGCTCKFIGGDVKQGETACISTAKGKSLARCEMMLNNTSWTVLNQPCDVELSLKKIGKNRLILFAPKSLLGGSNSLTNG